MTTLITGGTGKTGASLARLLQKADRPFIVASRSGNAGQYKAVKFDWFDPGTFENPFKVDSNIDRVYLVGPPGYYDTLPVVSPFIDLAISKGVKRFVFLSASESQVGDPGLGVIHEYILSKNVEYAILRPTWFSENLSTVFYNSIRENNEIFSATGEGKLAWISVEDIAQIAFDALTAEKSLNKDILILGPKLYSYDEVAQILSSILGREIKHKKNTAAEQEALTISAGLDPKFARVLTAMEVRVGDGAEEAYFNEVSDRKYLGKYTLEDYIRNNRHIWIK